MSKFSKETYYDAIRVLFPKFKETENFKIDKTFNIPIIVRLSAELYFIKDLESLTYKERLAFNVMKSLMLDLKKNSFVTFGDIIEMDLK